MSSATMTLPEAQNLRAKQIDSNRDLGVVEYKSGEKQADAIYEVIDGYKHLPGGVRLGPGQRFHPTERQIKNGSLRGKARELSAGEYRDARRPRRVFAGADFEEMERRASQNTHGSNLPPMTDAALEAAQAAGLTVADFTGIDGEGREGRYTKPQVDEIIEGRRPADG